MESEVIGREKRVYIHTDRYKGNKVLRNIDLSDVYHNLGKSFTLNKS